jgi:hypothetical protein
MELANSIVTLQPGMYILRHPKTGLPPISISRAAGKKEHNGTIQALYTPQTDGSVLRDGRDCIVMQVLNGAVDLLVTAYLEKAGATVPALKVDKIALDGEVASTGGKPVAIPPNGISIIGHIERSGDQVVTQGKRLGDPQSNLRLEGFQVMWPDKPTGLELSYSARVEGAGEMPLVSSGKFCGTRNAAKRIVGVTFSLTGPRASEYKLDGEAYFSGGFSCPIESGKVLEGPTGLEHLTGVTVNVSEQVRSTSQGLWAESSRTKVFGGKKSPKKTR